MSREKNIYVVVMWKFLVNLNIIKVECHPEVKRPKFLVKYLYVLCHIHFPGVKRCWLTAFWLKRPAELYILIIGLYLLMVILP